MSETRLDRAGRSDLHYASLKNQIEDVRRLLDGGADVNLPDLAGSTALHLAAQENSSEAIELLLTAGAAVESEDAYGDTPLRRATMSDRGDGTAIGLLRAAGADPWHANHHGVSPMILARRIANADVQQW